MLPPDDWVAVFEGPRFDAASERSLVLTSLDIPNEMLRQDGSYVVYVPGELAERSKFELWQYGQENRRDTVRRNIIPTPSLNAIPGVVAYVMLVCLVAWLAGEAAFGKDWLAAGRMDGQLFRNGEWWRSLTALTLHSDIGHLAGNIVFGTLFGLLAGRVAGSGLAWLGIVLAAALGNTINTLVLMPSHRSIGASTAVFAALGLVSGFVWRGRFMAQDRWPYRVGPIVGGIALLAYTGTGDENTDIGAHLAGFVCGFATGMLLLRFVESFKDRRVQLVAGLAALTAIAGSWIIALFTQVPAVSP
jgi:rhomboid protease GluP